jgi:hypothetical protein
VVDARQSCTSFTAQTQLKVNVWSLMFMVAANLCTCNIKPNHNNEDSRGSLKFSCGKKEEDHQTSVPHLASG